MPRNISPRKLALLGMLGLTATLLAGCPPPPPPPAATPGGGTSGTSGGSVSGELIIGHFASLTGNTAMFGETTDKGVKLAAEELNAAGGGMTVKVDTLDDASQQAQAPLVVSRLISQNQATAIVGEVASSRSIAAAPVANSKQVPMVSSASTNPDVTVDPRTGQTHPYVFRVCFTDPFQGAVIARFVREELKLSKAAVLKDVKNAYSVGLAKGFADKFTTIGGTIVAEEAYSEGDSDFRSQLTSIQGKSPEVLIVPGYYREAGLVIQQARTLGLKIPVMGGDGWDSSTLTDVGPQHFTECYFSNHFSPEEERPGVKEFVAAYKAKYNEEPNALAALGYDAVKIIADAAKRAGSLDRTAIRDALEKTKDYSAVTGQISIDAQHNPVKSAVVVKVPTEKGQPFKLVTTIKPE
jgi:branched-chain amino acid transport system substrate-binding protein